MNYCIIYILIILIILLLFYINKPILSTFNNINNDDILLENSSETVNNNNDNIIPLNIFMTWNTNDMPPNMKKSVDIVKSTNPEFNVYIYNDKDCYDFLKNNFIKDVVDAFDCLIPGAYKADLWRYCILYKYGGIYQDIKFQPVNNFKYIDLVDKEYFVRDIKNSGGGIYNALLICKPKNKILYKSIKEIIKNVKNKFYGKSNLEPTGPLLMKKFFSKREIQNLELYNGWSFINDGIYKNKEKILKFYSFYRKEQLKSIKPRYTILYSQKKIYNC